MTADYGPPGDGTPARAAGTSRYGFVLFSALVGPLAGLLFVLIIFAGLGITSAVQHGLEQSHFFEFPAGAITLMMGGLLPSFFVGAVPSVCHGAIMAALSLGIRSRGLWVAVTPLVGASACLIPAIGLGVLESLPLSLWVGALGATASVITLAAATYAGKLPPMRGQESTMADHDNGH